MIQKAMWAENGTMIEVIDDGRVLWVPDDMRNRHRVELAAWEAEGNTIEPYEVARATAWETETEAVAMAEWVAKGGKTNPPKVIDLDHPAKEK